MINIDLNQDYTEKHTCIGHQEGDWIIFTCPKCDYQRKMNWITGEMKTNDKNSHIPHKGEHFPLLGSEHTISDN
ncbi:MAG: hypothetical protein HC892_20640 [Saprospiraceae bacterium]|nr:hypothetical protein [Saprospiraceae bacterium]